MFQVVHYLSIKGAFWTVREPNISYFVRKLNQLKLTCRGLAYITAEITWLYALDSLPYHHLV